jgi:hypothetical protein
VIIGAKEDQTILLQHPAMLYFIVFYFAFAITLIGTLLFGENPSLRGVVSVGPAWGLTCVPTTVFQGSALANICRKGSDTALLPGLQGLQ